WPEHVKFDEKEEAIAFEFNNEGCFLCPDVDGKRHLVKGPGLRYYVQFNEFNQPLRKGGCILVSFLGDVAKRETFFLVGVSSWHKLKKKMKADIMILVRWVDMEPFTTALFASCKYSLKESLRVYDHHFLRLDN
ncbi:4-hydroxybenzoate octaprenyltransferase, partial [Bienertia sinuspersici]